MNKTGKPCFILLFLNTPQNNAVYFSRIFHYKTYGYYLTHSGLKSEFAGIEKDVGFSRRNKLGALVV